MKKRFLISLLFFINSLVQAESPQYSEDEPLTEEQISTILEKAEAALFDTMRTTRARSTPALRIKFVEQAHAKANSAGFYGLVDQVSELEKALKIAGRGSLLDRIAALETALGSEASKDEGAVRRLQRITKAYENRLSDEIDKLNDEVADLAADDFEQQYGNPGKLSFEQRITLIEKFGDEAERASRQKVYAGSAVAPQIETLRNLVPEAAGRFGTASRALAHLESFFSVAIIKEEKTLSESERVAQLIPLVESHYARVLKEARSKNSVDQRVRRCPSALLQSPTEK